MFIIYSLGGVNKQGIILAHLSAIASFMPHHFLVIIIFSFFSPLFLFHLESEFLLVGFPLSIRHLVSVMEPQHIKDIPANVKSSPLCCDGFQCFLNSVIFFLQKKPKLNTPEDIGDLKGYWVENM